MTIVRKRSDAPVPARTGEKLELGSVMERVSVSLQDLATAAGISKTAMFQIVASNVWPKTTDNGEIKEAVEQRLLEAGLSQELLATIWWAKRSMRGPGVSPSDYYGRKPGQKSPARAGSTDESQPRKATDMLLAKQSLGYQAAKHFTLFTNPFDGEVQTHEDLFHNGELRFVREAMWQAARNGRFVAVTGESGSGKTTLLTDLEDRILSDREPTTLIRPSVVAMTESESTGRLLKAADLVVSIILTLDPHAKLPTTHEARTRRMAAMVEESCKVGHNHLLVIEEAHALPGPTLQALKRLQERCRFGRRSGLGILLLAHPELRSKLSERRADLREVVQRCEIVNMPSLDSDLEGYLAHRVKSLKRPLSDFIDASGIEEVRRRLTVQGIDRRATPVSLLYPLAINNLMTAALNMAAELGVPVVTGDVVRAV